MKTYKELTDELIEKRNIKRSRNKKLIAIATPALCLVLITAIFLTALLPRINSKKTPATNTIQPITGYNDLYKVLDNLVRNQSNAIYPVNNSIQMPNSSSTAESAQDTSSSPVDYSNTNLQVIGVDEADIIKTDGKYIYVLASENIYIAAVNGHEISLASTIKGNTDDVYPVEIYIAEDRLIVMNNLCVPSSGTVTPEIGAPDVMIDSVDWYPFYQDTQTFVEVYDITDRTSPVKVNAYTQDGVYLSSRMIGNYLYLITKKNIYTIDQNDMSTYVPSYTLGDEKEYFKASNIYVSSETNSTGYSKGYLVVCGLDITQNVKVVSEQAVFGCGNTVYCSPSSIYSVAYTSASSGDKAFNASKIFRFSIANGEVKLTSQCIVPGTVLNQFSMDEYNGYFRIVTTVYSYTAYPSNTFDSVLAPNIAISTSSGQTNALYVLDSSLSIVGKLENIAPDERVYSVRFDGNIGYFVTFRRVDPLFAVDLSDPLHPTIRSALKIPGFSEYLHPYGSNMLFGFGKDADTVSGATGGIKLSMFDISDPDSVKEINKYVFSGLFYSPAEYDHKSILVDEKHNLIAFAGAGNNGIVYEIFKYSPEQGFRQVSELSLDTSQSIYSVPTTNVRGLFIGDYFYVISSNGINSYTMTDFSLVSQFAFSL